METALLSKTEIEQLRADTPGTAHVIHFNNAGAALPVMPVLNAISSYLQKEALAGGYEAEYQHREEIEKTYYLIAQLIGAQPEEIALVENASAAWYTAFHGISFREGDEVLISEYEYVTNMIGYLYGEKHYGISLKVIPNDENGNFSLSNLEEAITAKTRLIAVTHVASSTGGILPVEEIGEIAAKYGILYLLDACQSLGQMPVNVEKIKCDFLSATGRKFLRAPRGTGFLYVRKTAFERLTPLLIDGHSTVSVNENNYTLRPDAKRFELYEKNRALTLGLSKAIEYALNIGMDSIWQRISYLANCLRLELQRIPGVTITDTGNNLCGIVTFTISGFDSQQVKDYLALNRINVSVGKAKSTLLYMNKYNLNSVVRASVHYYNTEEEITRFCEALHHLTDKKV